MSFKRFDPEDITLSAESVVAPLWSTNLFYLNQFYTSSAQIAQNSGNYYYQIYQTGSSLEDAQIQFSIAFGQKQGSGSLLFNSSVLGKSPTSNIYGQYRTLVFGDEDKDFKFDGEATISNILVISFDRARYKEKLLPGSFNLRLGSTGELHLTDNSNDVTTTTFIDAGRVFQVVSGSNGSAYSGNGYTTNSGSYGLFLPDIGTVILNGNALNLSSPQGIALGADYTSSNTDTGVNLLFYNAIVEGASVSIQSEETVTSNFVFVRIRNAEFNYSTNPSNITGSGELRHEIMINSPQAYITSVGLYNDSNDLVAIAKLSRPLLKDFTKEALLRIKLDY